MPPTKDPGSSAKLKTLIKHIDKLSRAEVIVYVRLVAAGPGPQKFTNRELLPLQRTAARAISSLEKRDLIRVRYEHDGGPVRVLELV